MNNKMVWLILMLKPARILIHSGLFYLAWNILMAERFDQPRLGLAAIVMAMIPVVYIGQTIFTSVFKSLIEEIVKREKLLKELSGGEEKS